MGTIASALVTAAGSLAIAFISGWKLALVILAFVPFMIFGGMMEMKAYFQGNAGNLINSEEAGKVRTPIPLIMRCKTLHAYVRETTVHANNITSAIFILNVMPNISSLFEILCKFELK